MVRNSKIALVLFTLIIGLTVCNQGTNSDQAKDQVSETQPGENGGAVIKFAVDSYDFGDIDPGEKVSYTFTYVNGGEDNLIIVSATASCGCTIPKWSKDPLPPGRKGHVEVIFDSSGRSGIQLKNVTIKSNGDPAVKTLQIRANIVEPNS